MKKLAFLVMILPLATFVAAPASAQGWGAIQGTYAMTATGNCLHWWPNNDPFTGTYGASNMVQGFFQFSSDGTGKAWGENWPITPPPAPTSPVSLVGPGDGAFYFEFTYEVTQEGAITVWMNPSTFTGTNLVNKATFTSDGCGSSDPVKGCTMSGMVSRDHKTMTLATKAMVSPDGVAHVAYVQGYTFGSASGPPLIRGKTMYADCSVARTLFRVDEAE